MNDPKPTPEQFTHNGVLMQPHYDNAVRAWEKLMKQEEVEKAAAEYRQTLFVNSEEGRIAQNSFLAGAEWAKQQQGEGWISVETRLPEFKTDVLVLRDYTVYSREKRVDIGILHYTETPQEYGGPRSLGGQGVLTGYYWSFPAIVHPKFVTHWRPLPPPPTA